MTLLSVILGARPKRPALLSGLTAGLLALPAQAADGDTRAPAAVARSVSVQLEAPDDVDGAAVRRAVAEELGLEAAPAGASTPTRVIVQLAPHGELTVTYRAQSGAELSRTVAAPGRADELPEVTALLVGNLAQDEARGLVGQLETPTVNAAEPAAGRDSSNGDIRDRTPRSVDAFNLSLAPPLTLLSDTHERRIGVELGLFYSHLGGLSGLSLSAAGVTRIDGEASGVQLASLGFINGARADGARIAGLFGVGEQRFEGLDLAGAVLVQRGELAGAAIAGAVNVASGDVDGAQVTAGINAAHGLRGAQLAGAVNVARGEVDGAQLAGAVNVAGDVRGAQIAIINVGGDVDGAQIGIVNVARDVSGAQLGIVNVAREVDGASLAVVPYSRRGRVQVLAWYASTQAFNLGVRFQSGFLYVMPTLSYDPRGSSFELEQGKASYAPGISLGARLPLGPAALDFDVNQSSSSDGLAYDEHDMNLRYRLLASWQLTRDFGVFAGGGVHHHFRTQGDTSHEFDPELNLGISLL